MIPIHSYLRQFLANRIPPQLVIQLTNKCNAHCPQCGMRVQSKFPRSTLPCETLKKIIAAAAAKGVQSLSFTGGEPLLFLEALLELATYAGELGIPFVRTGTNGFLLRHSQRPDFENRIKRLAQRLAATNLRNFWISIDSAYGEVHEQMRGLKGVMAGIEKALPIFHAVGLFPSANMGINRLAAGTAGMTLRADQYNRQEEYLEAFYDCFRNAFDRFYRLVQNLGFTIVNTCYPMSIGEQEQADGLTAVYAATTVDDVVRFTAPEKAMLYKALMDTIIHYRRHMRIFSPLSSLHTLYRQHTTPGIKTDAFGCRGGVDFFFINAEDGNTYPCGYRGRENLGKFWQLDLSALKPDGDCHRCDWECFRDPSEMCAPLLQGLHQPLRMSKHFHRDPTYLKLWLQDIQYYRACEFFDGRRPMDAHRLGRF